MKRLTLSAALAVLAITVAAAADVSVVLDRAERAFSQTSVYSEGDMISYAGDRQRRSYTTESYMLTSGGVTRSLTVFTAPERMRGTAYLSVGDDLWVRFGSTGRVRKLGSSSRRDSAGGTDFSYADMGEGSGGISAAYTATILDERAQYEGEQCYEVELIPREGTDSPYDKLVAYITTRDYRYVAVEYYEDGAHSKTLTLSDYRTVDGVDYPFTVTMRNLARDTHTDIITRAVEFNSDRVTEEMFTPEYLEQME